MAVVKKCQIGGKGIFARVADLAKTKWNRAKADGRMKTFQGTKNGSFTSAAARLSVCLLASLIFVNLASAQTVDDQATTPETMIMVTPRIIIQEEEEERQVVIDPAGTTVALPTFAVTDVTTTVSVPDGGMLIIGGTRFDLRFRSSREMLNQLSRTARLENQVCTHEINEHGDSTYDILHDMKPLKIMVGQGGKIEMTLDRHYHEGNLEALQTDHPEIAMHVSAIPETSPGNGKVRLSLDIETTINADSVEELATDSPEYYKIFMRYVRTTVESK